MIRIGNFFFHYRNGLFPLACLLVLLPGKPVFADPLSAAALGFLVSLCGQWVRIATIGYEYVIRGGKNRRVYAEGLVTGGLYRLARNPMYVGNLLILLGIAIATNSWTCLGIAIPLFLFVYVAIVRAEEDYLRRKFGEEFELYCKDVPRWLPRLHDLGSVFHSGEFHWKRVLVKEYGTPVGWITMMLLIVLWQLHKAGLLRNHIESVVAMLVAFALLLVVYLRVRSLKLSRRLVAN